MESLTYVLDASSVVRCLERSAGSSQIEAILAGGPQAASLLLPAITCGKISYVIARLYGPARFEEFASLFLPSLEVIPITAAVAVRAGQIKTILGLGYADCFLVELALRTPGHRLITADYGFKRAEHLSDIEFLPAKP